MHLILSCVSHFTFLIVFRAETEEWSEFYGMFKSQLKLLAECLTARYPLTTMNTLSNYAKHLIATQQTIANKYNTDGGSSGGVGAGHNQQNNARIVENKSLNLDFEVFYTIYMPLFIYIAPPTGSAAEQHTKQEFPSTAAINFKAVEYCMCDLLSLATANTAADYSFVIEKFRLIACHNSLLKLFPIEYIVQIYMIYFDALSSVATGSNSGAIGHIKGKASTSIAVLTVVVADNIVKSSFLDPFLNQVSATVMWCFHWFCLVFGILSLFCEYNVDCNRIMRTFICACAC